MKRRIAVLGAGVAGLVTALTLARRGVDVIVVEGRAVPGGTIQTLQVEGCVVDAGPEALVATRPEALAMCASLGIADEMLSPSGAAGTWIARRSGPVRLPDGLSTGVPRRLGQLVTTNVLSTPGKLRAGLDLVLPHADVAALGALIERRMGREVKERLVEPIFGGIYGSDVDRLEAAFVAPHLASARGSLIRALAKERVAAGSPLRAPIGGMQRIVDALARHVGVERIVLGAAAARIARTKRGWRVDTTRGSEILADDIVVAMPPHAAAAVAGTMDGSFADLLLLLESHSTASVVFGLDAGDVRLPRASGIFVPRGCTSCLLGLTIVSNRWPSSAPAGTVVIRAIVGGARAPMLVDGASDERIAREAFNAIAELLPIPEPRWQRVVRFSRSQVFPEVGHMRRVAAARERARVFGRMHLVGAAYDGGGVAGILARAERTADAIVA